MKDEILQKLNAVIVALDSITVTGQQNRGNLFGSINILAELVQQLSFVEITAPDNSGESE